MPAATTHYEFAKEVYNLLPNEDRQLITNKPMYYVGAQGPDLLFFYKFSVLPGNICGVGNEMHKTKISAVINYFIKEAKNDPDICSYLCGYLCHYALDSLVHPLVNSYADTESRATGRFASEVHFRIESEYDNFILNRLGRSYKSYDVYKYMRLNDRDVHKLAVLYAGMLKEVFGYIYTVQTLEKAIKYVPLVTRLLKPGKMKYKVAGILEKVSGMEMNMITAMMLKDKPYTALNEDHQPWACVFDKDTVYTDSFLELYEKAIKKAVVLIDHRGSYDYDLNFEGEPINEH